MTDENYFRKSHLNINAGEVWEEPATSMYQIKSDYNKK